MDIKIQSNYIDIKKAKTPKMTKKHNFNKNLVQNINKTIIVSQLH